MDMIKEAIDKVISRKLAVTAEAAGTIALARLLAAVAVAYVAGQRIRNRISPSLFRLLPHCRRQRLSSARLGRLIQRLDSSSVARLICMVLPLRHRLGWYR